MVPSMFVRGVALLFLDESHVSYSNEYDHYLYDVMRFQLWASNKELPEDVVDYI